MTLDTITGHRLDGKRDRPSPLVVIAALIATMCIGAGLVIATLFAPHGRDTALLTGFIVSIIGPTVVGLLALLRSDHASQIGQSNAVKLTDATSRLESVAKDVNGHLTRHDDLAEQLGHTAEALTTLANNATPVARVAGAHTRLTDPPAPEQLDTPAAADAPPLDPVQG